MIISFSSSHNNPFSEDILVDSSLSSIKASIPIRQSHPGVNSRAHMDVNMISGLDTSIDSNDGIFPSHDLSDQISEITSSITPDHTFITCVGKNQHESSNLHLFDLTSTRNPEKKSFSRLNQESVSLQRNSKLELHNKHLKTTNKRSRAMGASRSSFIYSFTDSSHNSIGVIPIELVDKDDLPSKLKALAINDLGTAIVCSNMEGDLFLLSGM